MPIQSLLEKLNLIGKDGFFFFEQENWPQKAGLSKRVEESLNELQPTAFFCINYEPLVLFSTIFQTVVPLKESAGILINHP